MSINRCKLATGARCRFVSSVGMTMPVTCTQNSQSLRLIGRLTAQMESKFFPGILRTGNFSTVSARRAFCSVPRQQRCMEKLRNVAQSCNKFLNVMAELFAKQCNAIAAQRTRRMAQIINLYSNLYDRQTVVRLMEKMGSNYLHKGKGRKIAMLLGACLFNWNQEQISTEEMDNCGHEIYGVRHLGNRVTLEPKFLDHWEKVIDRDHLHAWRRPLPNSHLYEYKVLGTFKDIPARAFFKVQVDLEYRKQWDGLVVSLDLVERDEESGTEMVRWVMHFPYPMRAREYIYTRKYETYKDENLMVFVSRASEHPNCPITDEFVRVAAFSSKMVIKPHTTFDENGFDYILTYHDDPQATIPGIALRWMASTGVPNFVEQLHEAARGLHNKGQREEVENDDNAIPM